MKFVLFNTHTYYTKTLTSWRFWQSTLLLYWKDKPNLHYQCGCPLHDNLGRSEPTPPHRSLLDHSWNRAVWLSKKLCNQWKLTLSNNILYIFIFMWCYWLLRTQLSDITKPLHSEVLQIWNFVNRFIIRLYKRTKRVFGKTCSKKTKAKNQLHPTSNKMSRSRRSRNLKFSSEVFIKSDEQRTIMEKVTLMRSTTKSELSSSTILQ